MKQVPHQYIERHTGKVKTERLYGDRAIHFLYSPLRERFPHLLSLLTSPWASSVLGFMQFDSPLGFDARRMKAYLERQGVDLSECLEDPEKFLTPQDFFERKIRYWECRPLPQDPRIVVSPADSRVIVGSLLQTSSLFLKEKFFCYEELLGINKKEWLEAFSGGDFAIFRLTPDKYHYNHTPVAGRLVDFYEIPGGYHSCNPGAAVTLVTPYSKNKRVVTIIDTDVPNGSAVGLVALIEIVALMIGDIVQCYSEVHYDDPQPIVPGLFIKRGYPKSRYRPGSSTDVVIFQKGRIRFDADLIANMYRIDATNRYSQGFGKPLVETDIRVRSSFGSIHCELLKGVLNGK